MSTSATPASSSYLGQCVVCGKETSTKCSSCQRAGLNWMYFCSVGHQRSIWKLHKRVCGKNPFEWPPLNDTEAEELLELRDEICNRSRMKTFTQMMTDPDDKYVSQTGESLLPQALIFRNMLESSKLPANSDQHPAQFRPDMIGILASFRVLGFNTRLQQFPVKGPSEEMVSPENTQRLLLNYPFDVMAYLIEEHTGSRTATDHPCWQSDYLHRFLIFVATIIANFKSDEIDPNNLAPGLSGSIRHTAIACAAANPTANIILEGDRFDELIGKLVAFVNLGLSGGGDSEEGRTSGNEKK